MNSFYHHTDLGLINTLRFAGFQNISVVPSGEWTGLTALVQMGLFPDLPIWCQKSITRPIETLHRLWWKLLTRRNRKYDGRDRIRTITGAFNFYPTK